MTIWLTGYSGSGKSTVASALSSLLSPRQVRHLVLDGDDLREGLNADLGFTAEDRAENVRRVGEVALLFARAGHVVVVPIISPYAEGRQAVRRRHEQSGIPFVEVHVATPLGLCEERDPKGLYARARSGALERFTGISDPYEEPSAPEVRLETTDRSPEESAAALLAHLDGLGLLEPSV